MKKLIVLGALMMATTSAYASSDSLLYAGAAVGQVDYGDSGTDTAMGLRVGTGILPFIDIEAGYMNLGDLDWSGNPSISTVYVAAKPTVTLGIADVYARLGMHKWDLSGSGYSDDSTDLMFGVGVDYYLSDSLSVGASYTRYKFDGNSVNGDADTFAINATFHL